MALKQSKQILAGVQVPSPRESMDLVAITADYVTPTGGLAVGDIVELFAIPENCIPVDLVVSTGILGASVTLEAGIVSGTYGKADNARTQANAEFIAATAAATAVLLRMGKSTAAITPTDSPRGVGVKVAGATTSAGIAIRATLFVVPAPIGINLP
jgi:hypothetical protein